MADDDWYDGFFHGLALDLWRRAVTPEQTRREADFLAQQFSSRGPLVDVPCGNGRHALALAERGFRVTGVDLSAEFIAEAKSRAGTLPVDFVHGDMRTLELPSTFAGAYCMGNSFGYMPHEGTLAFLERVAQLLEPGGRFVLHTGTAAECLLPSLVERREMQVLDVHMLSTQQYVAAESRLETTYTFTRGAESQTGTARYHIYTAAELGRMLAAVGLRATAHYGGFAREPFTLGAPVLIIVADRDRS